MKTRLKAKVGPVAGERERRAGRYGKFTKLFRVGNRFTDDPLRGEKRYSERVD